MDSSTEGRNRIKGYTSLVGSINNLLETLDKDESVRNAIESSIIRIADQSPNEVLQSIYDFRQKQQKITEVNVATILRIVEHVTCTKKAQECLTEVTIQRISEMCIVELVKMPDMCPIVQKPALESLVALGRKNCDVVMENLMRQMQHGQVTHFMVLHSMGQLATANPTGIVNFLKHIFRILLPTLDTVKQDHVKQAHAFAIGRFCEAIAEAHIDESMPSEPADMKDEFAVEIGIAYEVLLNNWLMTREHKVCADILVALSHMFPLMAQDKIVDQLQKVIPTVVNLYRRSIDRISITQFLAAILKTSTNQSADLLNPVAYALCVSLFDLICVNPNYEKPQTVKGHNEVLRCFDLLAQNYSHHILDMLLIQLQSNNERERIKALLVLTHLTNTKDTLVSTKNREFCDILKQMISSEKSVRMKLVLLKTIIAFIQKSFTKEKIFIRFIVRHSCPYNKLPSEHGSVEEYAEFVQICNNSLFILSTTVGTIDDVLKRELLSYFMLQDYTSATGTLAKSLASLFTKDPQLHSEEEIADINTEDLTMKTSIPKPESVFVRCLALIAEGEDVKRTQNILLFLKSYATILNKHLPLLWNEKIPKLSAVMQRNGKFQDFGDAVLQFLAATIKDVDDVNFPSTLIEELKEQLPLYTTNPNQVQEFKIPSLQIERGTILRVLATCLCHILDEPVAEGIIDLIVNAAKQEKLEKSLQEGETNALTPAAKALGIISRTYLTQVLKKLDTLIQEEGRKKQTSGFFSTLNFMKESQKESDIFRVKLLVVESYGYIVTNCPPECFLKDVEKTIVSCLHLELQEAKDAYLKNRILDTLLSICQHILNNDASHKLKLRNELVQQILKIPIDGADNLPFLPKILRLGTALIRIQSEDEKMEESDEIHFLETICENFFTCAQKLKSKFESPEEDDRNSYLAKYLNESLPELNEFVRAILEQDPSPSCLDDIVSILERWTRDRNCEVRICAGHVTNGVLEVYMKTMKMGCEAPSKFNQTGHMIGKTVPRCIDSNATVRQISVDVLRKILEISHIYETLTLPDTDIQWVKDLIKVRLDIITDDPNEIYKLANEIARIVADRLPSFQHMALSRSLLVSLADPEKSSAIGASVVLKFFMQLKGSEMFHAITTLINECLEAISNCDLDGVKIGVLKAIVALAKHHPKLVCAEMLAQTLPYDTNVAQFWRTLCTDQELAGTVIDNFLTTLSSSCLYEPVDQNKKDDRNKIATIQPFAIICALKEILPCPEIQSDLKKRFPELFGMLLTTLATYTGVLAPNVSTSTPSGKNPQSKSSKFGFIPNKESIKTNPCEVVLLTFKEFLRNLGMEQVAVVFDVCPHLASSEDLGHFIDVVPPIANALVNELGISSTAMRQLVTVMSKYIPSPYEPQRIAAISLYSQLVPHKPNGETVSVIILHLNSSLNDPNALVRGCCLRGLGFVAALATFDAEKYSEITLTALMKGLDDANSSELMNIPLESIQGLSRIMVAMPCKKIEMFQISLAIRIRPFFENSTLELRNSAICLFGDVCQSKLNAIEGKSDGADAQISIEPFREHLYYNFCPLLLHLCEAEPSIARSSKVTLKKMCALLKAPRINSMAQSHLLEHGQLNYEVFVEDFVKVIGEELVENMPDFVDSCLPYFKSQWPEVRGNAAVLVGLLHQFNTTNQPNIEHITQKICSLLKDDNTGVKIKASTALGYLFSGQ